MASKNRQPTIKKAPLQRRKLAPQRKTPTPKVAIPGNFAQAKSPNFDLLVTTLPNRREGEWLMFSVLIAPRLFQNGPQSKVPPALQLGYFKKVFNWPAIRAALQFQVVFQGPGLSPLQAVPEWEFASAPHNVDPFDANLWQQLFLDTLLVRPYQFDQGKEKFTGENYLIASPSEKSFFRAVKQDLFAPISTNFPDRIPQKKILMEQLQRMEMVQPDTRVKGQFLPADRLNPISELNILGDKVLKFDLQRKGGTLDRFPFGPTSGQLPPRKGLVPGADPRVFSRGGPTIRMKGVVPQLSDRDMKQAAGLSAKQAMQLKFQAIYDVPLKKIQPKPQVPKIDFHQMVANLGDYPELMKRLGLRIDLRVKLVPKVPSQGKVHVVLQPQTLANRAVTPTTAYSLNAKTFRPKTFSPELQDGLLAFGKRGPNNAPLYDVVPGDVEGAYKRLRHFIQSLTLPNAKHRLERDINLPGLRSTGLSVAHNERDVWLRRLLDRTKTHQAALEKKLAPGAARGPNVSLYGEDLIRGYRIDVREVSRQPGGKMQFGPWRSLCFRHGEHRIGGPKAPPFLAYDDEGWVSLGATEGEDPKEIEKPGKPRPFKAPGRLQSQIKPIIPRAPGFPQGALTQRPKNFIARPILHIYESLFRWAGWSLCVSRPGKDLNPQDQPDYSGHASASDVPMHVDFFPVPGTLPRLRFGKQYQFRARVVDLAGNSVPVNQDSNDAKLVTPNNDGHYDRFEPISSPGFVLAHPTKTPPRPGDMVDRLVLRTLNPDNPQDPPAGPAIKSSMRHVVPPRVSQELAEQHSMFDSVPPQQAYQTIIEKDLNLSERWQPDSSFPGGRRAVEVKTPEFILPPNQDIEVSFLADPLATGAAFSNLPGKKPSGSVFLQPFTGNWPGKRSLRIQIQPGTQPPAFKNGVLQIFLPPGEQFTSEVSCFLQPGSENLLGLWRWIEERLGRSPKELAKIRSLVQQGRHWLITPSQDLHLVHAVQQPIITPVWAALENPAKASRGVPVTHLRKRGDTHAYLHGNIALHRASTAKFDLESHWSEPIDIGVPLTDPPQRIEGSSHVFEVPIIIQEFRAIKASVKPAIKSRGLEEDSAFPIDVDLTEEGVLGRQPSSSESLDNSKEFQEDMSDGGIIPRGVPEEMESDSPDEFSSDYLSDEESSADGIQERAVSPMVAQRKGKNIQAAQRPNLNPAIVAKPLQPQGPKPYDERPFRCAPPIPPLSQKLQPLQYRFKGKQQFIDTKYRCVEYLAIANTRYRDYFLPTREEEEQVWQKYEKALASTPKNQAPPPLPKLPKWTRTSPSVKVDILSSAPPEKPKVLYVLPTFKWENTPNGHRRVGGGLRVYLDRPWFSSGDGEQLAVVLYPVANPSGGLPEDATSHVTQWGLDPLWRQGVVTKPPKPTIRPGQIKPKLGIKPIQPRGVPEEDVISRAAKRVSPGVAPLGNFPLANLFKVGQSLPVPSHFRNKKAVRSDLGLREVRRRKATKVRGRPRFISRPMPVVICVFDVFPDPSRQLWYCDIEMDHDGAYFPFVRLALARYQVNSISGVHLSPVVQADFAQLVPGRTASVVADPQNPQQVTVTVAGVEGTARPLRQTAIQVTIEEFNPTIPGELGWTPISEVKPRFLSRKASAKHWTGKINLPAKGENAQFRLVIKEYEYFQKGSDGKRENRLVYADVLPVSLP